MKPILLSTCLGAWLCATTVALATGTPEQAATGASSNDGAAPANTAPVPNSGVATAATNTPPAPNAPAANIAPAAAPDQAPVADQTPQPPDDTSAAPTAAPVAPPPAAPAVVVPAVPLPAIVAVTNITKTVMLPNGEKGLIFNFRGAPLEDVLNYMSDAAGFIIIPKTDVRGKVTVWSDQPLSKVEAVKLLKQILNDNGFTVVQDGRTLSIIRSSEAITHDIRVIKNDDPASVPKNADIVTQIVPVHTLNAVQLVKNLESFKPSTMVITSDEAANSLVMTDTQENIHHIMEIVNGLDTVTSANATIRVFALKFADSKALASLIKDLYPNPDAPAAGGGGFRSMFGRMGRGGGGFPFGGGGAPGGENGGESGNGHTPTAKVNAVSDDHSNSLIVNAPDGLINDIAELVKEVDTPVEDTTTIQVFKLRFADPAEMADLLTSLFPGENGSSTDATRNNPVGFGFRGFGGFGGFPGGGQNNNSAASQSDRMKKLAAVIAVPDRRTASLVVTASTNLMPQIENMIAVLDKNPDRVMSAHVIPLANADPIDVQNILQNLFPSATGTPNNSTTTAQSNPLLNRQQTQLQQQNSSSGSTTIGGNLGTRGN